MTAISCSSEADFIPIEKITNSGIIYSNDDFKKIGFKESISYEVSDLPNVISAHYGFIKNELSKPEDYEIRFYANHQDAVKIGTKYAENITGENGCIRKECSLWIKNLKHRQKISEPANVAGGAGNGIPIAKYLDYIIHNNVILMCPGYDEIDAINKCTIVIDKLKLDN